MHTPPIAGLKAVAGFSEAFDTTPIWDFTFFAPSNDAFTRHTGQYLETFTPTPRGKWWLGYLVQHHYVPNTQLDTAVYQRDCNPNSDGVYLNVGTQIKDGKLWFNDVATVTEDNLRVTKVCVGVVHIIDRLVVPWAQIFEADRPRAGKKFTAGSCSDTSLPYC